jgi:hypothetical protein
MDIVSHSLWGLLAGKTAEPALGRVSGRQLAFWGAWPDLFAFSLPVLAMVWSFLTGTLSWSCLLHRGSDGLPPDFGRFGPFGAAPFLYDISHSLFVFLVIFLAVWYAASGWRRLRRDRLPTPMLSWLLHLLMDVPSHSLAFYPTPIFWPLSDWRFNGLVWNQPAFLLADYVSLSAFGAALMLYRWRLRNAAA